MKSYAFYNEEGKIKKIISTTKNLDFIRKNLPKDCNYVEVDHNIRTNSYLIVNGKAVKSPDFKRRIFKQPEISFTQSSLITEAMIDNIKDIEGLKAILKMMIAPKTISLGG